MSKNKTNKRIENRRIENRRINKGKQTKTKRKSNMNCTTDEIKRIDYLIKELK